MNIDLTRRCDKMEYKFCDTLKRTLQNMIFMILRRGWEYDTFIYIMSTEIITFRYSNRNYYVIVHKNCYNIILTGQRV